MGSNLQLTHFPHNSTGQRPFSFANEPLRPGSKLILIRSESINQRNTQHTVSWLTASELAQNMLPGCNTHVPTNTGAPLMKSVRVDVKVAGRVRVSQIALTNLTIVRSFACIGLCLRHRSITNKPTFHYRYSSVSSKHIKIWNINFRNYSDSHRTGKNN